VGESIRDRLAALSRRELTALTGVVLIGLAGVGLWYVRSLPHPVEVRSDRASAPPSASPSPAVIVVHVAGWVRHPGVYEFHEGDRVVDAINAAGGPKKHAALDSLNLASLLTDAEQVLVYKQTPGGAAASGTAAVPTASGAPAGQINVNTASATELEELPGIGEVLAQAIVDYRTENGPFTSVDQLEDVSGIGPATLEDIRDLVTV
jgi:competence protein ComEA